MLIFQNSIKVFCVLIVFSSSIRTQECPEIYVPPYGDKPRECGTSIGSTCLITCPDEFEIIGSCFRTCILNDETRQQVNFNADLKLSKKRNRPFLISLKPISFLPTSPINKMINSGETTTCCNKQQKETKNIEFTEISKKRKLNLNSHSIDCPNHSLPEHHLLKSLSKLMRQNEEETTMERQPNVPQWSGVQTYCVNTDVQCDELDPPENGFFYYCPNYAGLSCAIGCQAGYRLIGSRVLLCTRQGLWSDILPTCQQI